MWPMEHTQDFSKIWPGDLEFDPTWPIFHMKTNILTKFHDYQTENVVSRAYTRFFYDLTTFWSDMTHFQTRPRFNQDKCSDQVSW